MPPDPSVLRFKDQCASKINGPYPEVIAVLAAEGDLSVITDAQLLQEQRILQQIEEARQKESKQLSEQEERKDNKQQGRRKKKRRRSSPFLSLRNTILLVLVAILLSLGAFAGTFCGLGNCGELFSFRNRSKQENQNGNALIPPDASPVPVVVEFIQSKFRNTTTLRYPPLVGASSEELALAWIVQYDRKFPLPANAQRVVQRFVLAIFHFQQLKQYQNPIEGWFTNSDDILNECAWNNIVCNDENNSVQEINFTGVGLHGTIPDAMGLLSDLQVFSVADNALVGTLPATLGRCKKLKRLLVNNNTLMGTIPSSLEKLTNLEEASFQKNQLEGNMPISSTVTQVSADCDQVECPNCFLCCGIGQEC